MSHSKEILIVDDGEENVLFLSQILEDNGYPFRVARDGSDAIKKMAEKRPDLVLLDIMMPRKSGFTVYQEMKRDENLKSIPIIIVTGTSDVTGVDIKTGKEAPKETYADDLSRGVGSVLRERLQDLTPDALVEKPIDPSLLSQKIKELLA